jgi:NAD(P)H-hydrate repair Nnr-like enzyme with NAD(P)H-hydrate dehydratase domain
VIAAFLARNAGFFGQAYQAGLARPDEDALAGAQVHGLAGRIVSERLGEGTTASDVAAAIPEAIRRHREAG